MSDPVALSLWEGSPEGESVRTHDVVKALALGASKTVGDCTTVALEGVSPVPKHLTVDPSFQRFSPPLCIATLGTKPLTHASFGDICSTHTLCILL